MNEDTFLRELPGILILSHGPMCESIIESAELIVGEMDNIIAIPLEAECDLAEYCEVVINTYNSLPSGSIVLFDLQNGTPFNQLVTYCAKQGIVLDALCGVNLPILLEAWTLRGSVSGGELIKALEQAGHSSLINVAEFMGNFINN